MRGVTTMQDFATRSGLFLLTRLMRGVTTLHLENDTAQRFLLTRLMRGVTSVPVRFVPHHLYFYSHASCEA